MPESTVRMLVPARTSSTSAAPRESRSAAIVLLTDYTRTLCEEAGAESLGWCVGLAGRCLVLAAAWPLLEEILQTIGSIAR